MAARLRARVPIRQPSRAPRAARAAIEPHGPDAVDIRPRARANLENAQTGHACVQRRANGHLTDAARVGSGRCLTTRRSATASTAAHSRVPLTCRTDGGAFRTPRNMKQKGRCTGYCPWACVPHAHIRCHRARRRASTCIRCRRASAACGCHPSRLAGGQAPRLASFAVVSARLTRGARRAAQRALALRCPPAARQGACWPRACARRRWVR